MPYAILLFIHLLCATFWVGGVTMILLTGSFRSLHWRVEAMMSIAIVMAGIYVYIRASVFKALRRAVEESAWPVAAARLNTVRKLVSLNLGGVADRHDAAVTHREGLRSGGGGVERGDLRVGDDQVGRLRLCGERQQ